MTARHVSLSPSARRRRDREHARYLLTVVGLALFVLLIIAAAAA